MKASDLMIGNWVSLNYDINYKSGEPIYAPVQVTGINKDGTIDVNFTYDKSESMQDGWDMKLVEPIPLTKEILEKNGFVFKHDIFDGIYPMLSMIYCDYKLLEDDKWINGRENQNIRYVHELQNALKFCKVEREIVL